MLRSTNDLKAYVVGASDGPIGHVTDVYFDDASWVVRYLVVETGAWLSSRKVLISPISILRPNWTDKELPVSLTKDQVRNSPDIDTDKPVSRQNEMRYFGYYGYPYYWGGAGLWGGDLYPDLLLPGYSGFGSPTAIRLEEENAYAQADAARHQGDDPHLRSGNAVTNITSTRPMATSATCRVSSSTRRPGPFATWSSTRATGGSVTRCLSRRAGSRM